jgi:hypothetical protein
MYRNRAIEGIDETVGGSAVVKWNEAVMIGIHGVEGG